MSLRILDSQFAPAQRPQVPCTDCDDAGEKTKTRGKLSNEQAATNSRESRAAQRSLGTERSSLRTERSSLRTERSSLRTAERQTQQSAQLEIKTQDGDTVTLSFASRSLEQSQSLRTPNGYAQSQQSSASFEFKLNIEGNLSDAEVADIKKVIEGLNNPAPPSSDLSSLESYSYAYQRSSTFSASTLSYSA